MKKEEFIRLSVSLYLEYGTPKLFKVKAHNRHHNGKIVKVRSHYRRVEGRQVAKNVHSR